MSEQSSAQIQNEAAIIREFVNHPGMKLLTVKLDNKLAYNKNLWLNAKSVEEAETVRQNARSYAILMSVLNEFLVRAKQDEANAQPKSEVVSTK